MKKTSEFQKFDRVIGQLLGVSHSKVKAKLDAEKRAKKRKKSRKSSASRVANAKG